MNKAISFDEFQHQIKKKTKNHKEDKSSKINNILISPLKYQNKNDIQKEFKPILSTVHQPVTKTVYSKEKSKQDSAADSNKNKTPHQSAFKDITPEKDKNSFKNKPNKEELLEFQQKTISRLIDRRREYKEIEKHGYIMDKKCDSDIRLKRKEKMKSKTIANISNIVDKQIFADTLLKSPELVLDFKMSEIYNEKLDFENIIMDLMSDANNINSSTQDLSPLDRLNNLNNLLESPATRTNRMVTFLNNNSQKSKISSELHNNDSLISPVEISHGEFNVNSAVYKYLKKTLTFNISSNKPFESDYNTDDYNKSNQTTCDNNKPFSNNSLKSFEKNNLLETLDDNQTMSRKKIKTSGLMAQFIDNNKNIKDKRAEDALNHTGSNTSSLNASVHDSSSPRQRVLRSSSFTAANINKPMNSDTLPQSSKPTIYTCLVDSIFLVGPSKTSIEEFIKNKVFSNISNVSNNNNKVQSQNEKSDENHLNKSLNFNDSFFDNNNNIIDMDTFLKPEILFATESENPSEMLSLLPAFCYSRYNTIF